MFALKKFLIYCSFLLLITLVKNEVLAADNWEYYQANPILSPSADSWDSRSVSVPSVIFDQDRFKMWYQGQQTDFLWSIGIAESSDGLLWIKNFSYPLISRDNDIFGNEMDIGQPSVVKNDLYRMWYTSYTGANYFIRYATSIDGINWQKYPGYVMSGTHAWENRGVTNPYVIFKDNQYWMWYQAWGNGDWKIGLAQSSDGINWQKYPNNPLNLPSIGSEGGPGVIFWKNEFHMWYTTFYYANPRLVYHVISSDGINWYCQTNCEAFTTDNFNFNSVANYTPRPLLKDNNLYLYFAGSDGITTQIGLYRLINNKEPIVILPGFFASWNKQALIYNQSVAQSEWKLFSGVKEYNGLISTLKNLGYSENQDYFIFPYDWRKSLDQTTHDLDFFLYQKIWNQKPQQKINLIGHSLGGLLARLWLQKYANNSINKLITLGSPHQGVVQAYKPLAAGELDRENTLMWLAEKLILLLNKSAIESDKTTITNKFPILFDLLPTFNYLKDINNNEIWVNNLSLQNNLLNAYADLTTIIPFLYAFYGEKQLTPSGYKIGDRSITDLLFNYYPDGRPLETYQEIGDGTVLEKSAKAGINNLQFYLDHSELITDRNAIKKILDLLTIPYQASQITTGEKTILSPSLIFLLKSPINLSVQYLNQEFKEQDEGIIFLENAQSGDYQLNIQGNDWGKYEVDIFQIAQNNELFEKVEGEITAAIPQSQIDKINFTFNSQSASSALLSPTPTITLLPTATPTPSPVNTPTPTPTPFPTTITPFPTATTIPQLTNQSTTNSTVNNLIMPTIFINNINNLNSSNPIASTTPYYSYPQILGEKTDLSSYQNSKQNLSQFTNSLNNLWRIITILLAGTIIIYLFYNQKKNINSTSN